MAQKHTLAKMETEKDYPYSAQFDDIYFSTENGVAETLHVFIDGNDLTARFKALSPHQIFTIGETGFGTGLNCLIAAQKFIDHATDTAHLFIYSTEKFPLSSHQISHFLGRWRHHFPDCLDHLIQNYPLRLGGWHRIPLHPRVTLITIFDDTARALSQLPISIDAWFLDGFAPAKNPDMWSDDIFRFLSKHSHAGTSLASFTAAGSVRRGLSAHGFHIEKTKGYGHKRDMIIGRYIGNADAPTTRYISRQQSIAVIGAGLAGSQIVHHLKNDHHHVTLFEERDIASGASGNPVGLYNPRLSAERNGVSDFYSSAFSALYYFISKKDDVDFNPTGALHLITDETKDKRYQNCLTSWMWDHDHATIINAKDASELSGVALNHNALWLKDSGSVSPSKLCHTLCRNVQIEMGLAHIKRDSLNNKWIVNDRHFDHVILAGGAQKIEIQDLSPLPIQSVRGQIIIAEPTTHPTSHIKTALCYGGYISATTPTSQNVIGSSFQPWLNDPAIRTEDNDEILQKLYSTIPSLKDQFKVRGARVGFRGASPDRTPMIGPYSHHENLWISGAHGSHGLLSSYLAARIITNAISNKPAEVGQHILDAINPIRFEKRAKDVKTKP